MRKLAQARADYEELKAIVTHSQSNDTKTPLQHLKCWKKAPRPLSKEESGQLAQRQHKFIPVPGNGLGQNREQNVWSLPRNRQDDSKRTSSFGTSRHTLCRSKKNKRE